MRTEVEQLGGYRILGEIGRGGMGVVYLGRDDRLGRDVAIKAIGRSMASDPARVAEFKREARIIASLDHPNIVRIYQMLEIGSQIYLVLEYVPGRSLDRILAESGPLAPERALWIAAQIASALAAAHATGICHRDLKPSNVRVRENDSIKVLDFGLAARPAVSGSGMGALGLGARMPCGGTPGYAAPEQFDAAPPDPRADVFSLGCVMYECLSGRRAFFGEDARSAMEATLHGTPEWSVLPEGLAEPAATLVRRCLAKDPEQRPQSMNEIAGLLETLLGRRPRAPSTPRPLPDALRGMPHHRTSFVGRADELRRLTADVRASRLVSILGPGGSGKTRLAAEVAPRLLDAFPDGVHWIDLAAVRDGAFVPGMVASSLGLDDRPGADTAGAIACALSDWTALLIFDNCEHVLAPVGSLIARILSGASGVHVLATTRERLRIEGEQVMPLSGLPLPADADDPLAARTEAVDLFVQRARLIDPDFEPTPESSGAIARICRRLDGIPLAIEFAANRAGTLSPAQIEAHLADRFRLLAGAARDAPERFRTMRAAIDWSYDLLSGAEQRMLRRLSVFAGGWTLEGALAVCAQGGADDGTALDEFAVLDLLTNLVEKSIVRLDRPRGRPVRYSMLETLREYAAEKLQASGEEDEAVALHLRHFEAFAGEASAHFGDARQAESLQRVEDDHENILAALSRALGSPALIGAACRLTGTMLRFWQLHGYFRTGMDACERVLSSQALVRGSPGHAATLQTAAVMALKLGDLRGADGYAGGALRIVREHGDRRACAKALNVLGNSAYFQQRFADAEGYHTEALAIHRETGDVDGIGASLNNLANIAHDRGLISQARPLYEQALAINRETGNRASAAINMYNLGLIAYHDQAFERSRRLLDEALALRQGIGDRFGIAETLSQLARVAIKEGRVDAACASCLESLQIRAELGDRMGLGDSLDGAAMYAASVGEHEHGAVFFGASDGLRAATGAPRSPWELEDVEGCLAAARRALGDAAFQEHVAKGRAAGSEAAIRDAVAWLRDRVAVVARDGTAPTL